MTDNRHDAGDGEIDIEKLLGEIRTKQGLKPEPLPEPVEAVRHESPQLPQQSVPPPDVVALRAVLESVRAFADVGAQVSPMEQFPAVLRPLARMTGRAVLYLSSFLTDRQRNFNRAAQQMLGMLTDSLERLNAAQSVHDHTLKAAVVSLQEGQERLSGDLREALKKVHAGISGLTEAINDLSRDSNSVSARVEALKKEQAQTAETLSALKREQAQTLEALSALSRDYVNTRALFGQNLQDLSRELEKAGRELRERAGLIAGLEQGVSYLKSGHALHEKRIAALLDSAAKGTLRPAQKAESAEVQAGDSRVADALYAFIEESFRGSSSEIRERQKVYIPILTLAGIGKGDGPVIDLGCGRGEWLDLLTEEGVRSTGVDLNAVFVESCRSRGLDVIEADALSHLASLPDSSVAAVTAFHLIEHLPFDVLVRLLDETLRVLKPGGLMIIETPNPENVLVGSCTFYLDPTHRNPLPPAMTRFVAEARGFTGVDILRLHPYPPEYLLSGSPEAERFNGYFYGPQDYAVLGRKP